MDFPAWTNDDKHGYQLKPVSTRHLRGELLPGMDAFSFDGTEVSIFTQEWRSGFFWLGARVHRFMKRKKIGVHEPHDTLRLEAVLKGTLHIKEKGGKDVMLREGQYHVTNRPAFTIIGARHRSCHYFVSYFSKALLTHLGMEEPCQQSGPRPMPQAMYQKIREAFQHRYGGPLKDLYYRTLVIELFLLHLTNDAAELLGGLREEEIAAALRADAILAADITQHYSIGQLSGKVGTNAFKLKKAFRILFKMGVFKRLWLRRMEKACYLLRYTHVLIKDIATDTGYDTVGGFIQAFRKHYKITPQQWREKQQENDHEKK